MTWRKLRILSLLAAIGITALWIDGFFRVRRIQVQLPTKVIAKEVSSSSILLYSGNGGIGISRETCCRSLIDSSDNYYTLQPFFIEYESWPVTNLASDPISECFYLSLLNWRVLGFGIYDASRQDTSIRVISLPQWLLVVVSGAWPTVTLVKDYRRRRCKKGTCVGCGYDLRGTYSGTCPECGKSQADAVQKHQTGPIDETL